MMDFHTWRMLTEQGLSQEETVDFAVRQVGCAAG
jgi:hypothetical protein